MTQHTKQAEGGRTGVFHNALCRLRYEQLDEHPEHCACRCHDTDEDHDAD